MEDNSHAGQGAVLLDIGGDVGALILRMPRRLLGVEIEARPIDLRKRSDGSHHHVDGHDHPHTHPHAHGDGAGHDGAHHHLPHVAVIERPLAGSNQTYPTAVFSELLHGRYELYERPAGAVTLTVDVQGGEVTEVRWPDAALAEPRREDLVTN
jgi:hypothetical protein